MIDRPHADALEQVGKTALHRPAVFQDVADAAGAAAIVLQHHVVAVGTANEIRAADVDVNVLGHIEIDEFAPEMFAGEDVEGGDDAVLDDFLLVINVAQEEIQGGDALHQAALQMLPFARPG